ncbi:glutaredoxin domain-containing protein [Corynebacterium diphtheriae]
MNRAIVYGRPGCVRCRQTERKFAKFGVIVISECIDDFPDKQAEMEKNNEFELPLVELELNGENYRWTGLRDKNFEAVKELLK